MQIIEEGEQAFLKQLEVLLRIPEIREKDHQSLLEAKEGIVSALEWREVLLSLMTNLTMEVMAMKISPELRDFYSLLYNNRESIEGLTHDIKGSMTLLMIFDNE